VATYASQEGQRIEGLRDRAIVLTLVLTGRRRAEVLSLRVGDLSVEHGRTWYRYRGKGGKTGRRELPEPALLSLTPSSANR
jgi:integrase